jgi:hypothetical protein
MSNQHLVYEFASPNQPPNPTPLSIAALRGRLPGGAGWQERYVLLEIINKEAKLHLI